MCIVWEKMKPGKATCLGKGGEAELLDLGWHQSGRQMSESTDVLRSVGRLFWIYSDVLRSADAPNHSTDKHTCLLAKKKDT